jgi:hypothetical protein
VSWPPGAGVRKGARRERRGEGGEEKEEKKEEKEESKNWWTRPRTKKNSRAFFVSDVTGGRTDHTRYGMLFHVF